MFNQVVGSIKDVIALMRFLNIIMKNFEFFRQDTDDLVKGIDAEGKLSKFIEQMDWDYFSLSLSNRVNEFLTLCSTINELLGGIPDILGCFLYEPH